MVGFMRWQEGFEAGKHMGGGEGRILENRYSFFVLDAYFGGGEHAKGVIRAWRMVDGSWMIRGIEGGNARGARLQYFVLARFAGSVGEYEVVKGYACSHNI
jgi:hypothetical protein